MAARNVRGVGEKCCELFGIPNRLRDRPFRPRRTAADDRGRHRGQAYCTWTPLVGVQRQRILAAQDQPTPDPAIVLMTPPDLPPDDDTPLTGRYIAVLVLEALIIAILWVIGRIYS